MQYSAVDDVLNRVGRVNKYSMNTL